MSGTASEFMQQYVWPEIQAMILNDAHFRLVLSARRTKRACHRSQISKPYPCSWFNSLVGERVIFNRIFSSKSGAISNCIAVGNWREDFLPNSVPPRSILASDGDFYGAQTLGEADEAGVLE